MDNELTQLADILTPRETAYWFFKAQIDFRGEDNASLLACLDDDLGLRQHFDPWFDAFTDDRAVTVEEKELVWRTVLVTYHQLQERKFGAGVQRAQ